MKTFKAILAKVRYKDFYFHVGRDGEDGRFWLQVRCKRSSATSANKDPQDQYGRKFFLSDHMTHSEVVRTAFKACLTFEEHECRENFYYADAPIFGPHIHVDALAEVCRKHDKRPYHVPDLDDWKPIGVSG